MGVLFIVAPWVMSFNETACGVAGGRRSWVPAGALGAPARGDQPL